jgi:uncharacterized protein (DUF427 family)
MTPRPDRPRPGQESVWDYPRPPRLEPVGLSLRVEHAGQTVAQTVRGLRYLETSHPPTYYLPPGDVRTDWLRPAGATGSFCEWKGRAVYFDLAVSGSPIVPAACWSYPDPTAAFRALRDHVAFYAGKVDACWVGDEQATPQPGAFYGGWVTRSLAGPFKGVPGSHGW